MKKKINIILTGVGGHGVITAANILGKAAVNAGVNVFVSETHGMAQRGGSVVCNVRLGEGVSGALIPSGSADAIVSTEPIEALRYIKFANNKTMVITDRTPVVPFTVSTGLEKYPDLKDVFNEIKKHALFFDIDALDIAKKAGGIVTKNIVMLGALSATGILPFKSDLLLETILQNIPDKYAEINKKAFVEGEKALKKLL